MSRALIGALTLDSDGQHLHGRFNCGGKLTATETATTVTVTYTASAVGPGTMACALVPLRLALPAPAGHRTFVDGVTGKPLTIAGR